MAVESIGEKYSCLVCGNEVTVTKVGGGVLVCCGQEMKFLGASQPKPIDDEIPVGPA